MICNNGNEILFFFSILSYNESNKERNFNMKLQRLLSLTRQAVDAYALIQDKDRIVIGISGGKDSLTLLYALHGLKRFYPKHFELCAITVDLGLKKVDWSPVKALCEQFSVPYTVIPTDIGTILFQIRQESTPCALCAKMRKGALNQAALELGCNKIAYAHHKDDVIETMMLSLLYEGRFYSFSPKTYWDKTGLTLIRPMFYVREADVIGFQNKYQLPVCKNLCPIDGHTKREYAKTLLRQLERENPGSRDRMFHAILNGNLPGWPNSERKEDTIYEPDSIL